MPIRSERFSERRVGIDNDGESGQKRITRRGGLFFTLLLIQIFFPPLLELRDGRYRRVRGFKGLFGGLAVAQFPAKGGKRFAAESLDQKSDHRNRLQIIRIDQIIITQKNDPGTAVFGQRGADMDALIIFKSADIDLHHVLDGQQTLFLVKFFDHGLHLGTLGLFLPLGDAFIQPQRDLAFKSDKIPEDQMGDLMRQ